MSPDEKLRQMILKQIISQTMQDTYPQWVLWDRDHKVVMDLDRAGDLIAEAIRCAEASVGREEKRGEGEDVSG